MGCGWRVAGWTLRAKRAWRDEREGKKVRRWEAQTVDGLNPNRYHQLSQPCQLNQPINSINSIQPINPINLINQ